ncbi:TRAP transporter substrate-binding protein [Sporosarcina sp. JAI121]|uniref:TRAP transporter substrate-binding protein n=1 Tax=Sporosarcina sp. JAI121 TaxID=2723064 RepID=UPI0015C70DD1|nr:TRAP transporter substrate-binding protein [Sporosarcina sp. JAI121]NYF23703.1 tripartite ATP-independent transporter DctP family solute receptor [Sporosarcina sp. JAI121]
MALRKIVKSGFMLGIAMMIMAGCSSKGGQDGGEMETLSLAHGGSLDSHLQQGALKFQELVEEKSNGEIKIQIHPNSELGAEREAAESVQNGSIDIAILSTGPMGNFADKVNALDFPFLFKDHVHAEKVLDGEVGEIISKQLEDANFKNLYWVDNGAYHIATNEKPVRQFSDLKGLKLRTQENQIQIDTINAFKASATPIPFSELFLSAQQGIVDGQGNSLAVLIPQKYYEVHKYLTVTNHMYSAGMILMNNDKFSGYPEDTQQILLEAAKEAGAYEREYVQQLEKEFKEIAVKNGMEIIEDTDLEPFKEAVQPIYQKYEKKFGDIHKIVAETE